MHHQHEMSRPYEYEDRNDLYQKRRQDFMKFDSNQIDPHSVRTMQPMD